MIEEDRDLLENIEASLRQRSLAMIRVEEIGDEPSIVGTVPDHLVDTLVAIRDAGSITNADLAKNSVSTTPPATTGPPGSRSWV